MPRILPAVFLLFALAAACNFPGLQEPDGEDRLATSAAETVSAQLTQVFGTQPAADPTGTPAVPPSATATIEVQPTNSPTPDCTNKAAFVDDVTIPDDTNVPAGDTFDKIWRLRNAGTCTWNTEYDVVFEGGNIMAGPPSAPLPRTVPPGATVDVKVGLTAPASDGTHRGDWKLRTQEGKVFGIGSDADDPFFVQIVVGAQGTEVVYDFVANYCNATWQSGAGTLSCPGSDTDVAGFVSKLDAPQLESGRQENEPALFTHPQWVTDGSISGKFPPFDVKGGDEFRAVIGCLFGAVACDMTMQLGYHKDGGGLQVFREWDETYDDEFRVLEVELSELAGSSVEFVLIVQSRGSYIEDWAFWLSPRIVGTPR